MRQNHRHGRRPLSSFEIACRRADRAARQIFRDEERAPVIRLAHDQHTSADTDRQLAAS